MKRWGKRLLNVACVAMLAAAMTSVACAATDGYTSDCAGEVNYDDQQKVYTAAYSEAIAGEQYALIVVKGDDTSYSVNSNTIMHIDQKAASADGTVSFEFVPRSNVDCVALLGGKLQTGTSPVVLGTISAQREVPAKPYKIANVVSGVHVYWKAVEGAEKYGLWRSETGKNGKYVWIANPTDVHFTDLATKATKAVESGKTYYYKVTAVVDGEHSAMSEPIGITFVSTPDITNRYNKAAGITVEWEKITGATGYAIYRKSYSGTDAWVRVATIEGNSTFKWQDTSVANANGSVYKYTIRALAGSDMKTLSGCRNAGRTMVRLTSRTLTSAVKASGTSITCKWGTTAQATGYEVRFLVGSEVYKTVTIGNYKTGTKTFTGLAKGKTYKIQVRSYKKVDGVGSFYSAWSAAKNVTL